MQSQKETMSTHSHKNRFFLKKICPPPPIPIQQKWCGRELEVNQHSFQLPEMYLKPLVAPRISFAKSQEEVT